MGRKKRFLKFRFKRFKFKLQENLLVTIQEFENIFSLREDVFGGQDVSFYGVLLEGQDFFLVLEGLEYVNVFSERLVIIFVFLGEGGVIDIS